MRRFFQPSPAVHQGCIALTSAEAHHAAHVIRLRKDEPAVVLDGKGGEFFCTVIQVGRREVALRVDRAVHHEPPRSRIRLVQAITKGKSFDLILQKAVELGAREIQPVLTEHVVARPGHEAFAGKRDKWNQILIEAAKQCGAWWLPDVFEPLSVPEALADEQEVELRLVAVLGQTSSHPRQVFDEFFEARHRCPESVSVWIGPEGDFTAEEVGQIVRSGAKPVSLGDRVLRSETAALSALAILSHEFTAPR